MPPSSEPQHAGAQHLLGPHVVGQRVVVRRVLRGQTGPSGGPAMTDVLGMCTSWDGTSCTVVPADGPPVHIAVDDIVTGKVIPPRPSPRLRVSPADAQRRALALWPDLETRPLGDWLLRHSSTSTARRARSVLAMGPSGVADDYEQVVEFYRSRTGRPIAAVLPDSDEEATFRGHGWVAESGDADTLFQLAGVAQVRRALPPSGGVELIEDESVLTARIGDHAQGFAAYDADWIGIRGLEVAPTHRRQGLALQIMSALLEWGAERGATTAYLQVLGDNTAALKLYDGLGFVTHHAYRYLAP